MTLLYTFGISLATVALISTVAGFLVGYLVRDTDDRRK